MWEIRRVGQFEINYCTKWIQFHSETPLIKQMNAKSHDGSYNIVFDERVSISYFSKDFERLHVLPRTKILRRINNLVFCDTRIGKLILNHCFRFRNEKGTFDIAFGFEN